MSAVCREEVRNPAGLTLANATEHLWGRPAGGRMVCGCRRGQSLHEVRGPRGQDPLHRPRESGLEAAEGGEESSPTDSRTATRLVTCSRGRQAGAFAPGALHSPGSQSRLGVHGGGRLGPPKGWCFVTTEPSQVHGHPCSGSAERRGRPARASSEPPGSTARASGRGAGCESGRLTDYSVKAKRFGSPGGYEEPRRGLVRTGLRESVQVFTLLEGLISVKDGRALASENHVCTGFFLPASTQAPQRSDTVQSRSALGFRRGPRGGLTRCRAPTRLWIFVPSDSGFCELDKGDTGPSYLFTGSNQTLRAPCWRSLLGTSTSRSGDFPWPRGP